MDHVHGSPHETIIIERLPSSLRVLTKPQSVTDTSLPTARAAAGTQRKTLKGTWSKSRLDDIAYGGKLPGTSRASFGTSMTGLRGAATSRAAGDSSGGSSGGGASSGGPSFLSRIEAVTARITAARADAVAAAEFEARLDKPVCTFCGRQQTLDEFKRKQRTCTRATCGGASFKPRQTWEDIAPTFLGRLAAQAQEAHAKRTALEKSVRPPFRLTHRAEFDAETGKLVEIALPKQKWSEVADDFFERQEEFKARHEETLRKLEEERQRRIAEEAAALQGIPKLNHHRRAASGGEEE